MMIYSEDKKILIESLNDKLKYQETLNNEMKKTIS